MSLASRRAITSLVGASRSRSRCAVDAQSILKQGRSLKHIASEVGYGSEVALSRAFSARVGMSARAYKSQAVLDAIAR